MYCVYKIENERSFLSVFCICFSFLSNLVSKKINLLAAIAAIFRIVLALRVHLFDKDVNFYLLRQLIICLLKLH